MTELPEGAAGAALYLERIAVALERIAVKLEHIEAGLGPQGAVASELRAVSLGGRGGLKASGRVEHRKEASSVH